MIKMWKVGGGEGGGGIRGTYANPTATPNAALSNVQSLLVRVALPHPVANLLSNTATATIAPTCTRSTSAMTLASLLCPTHVLTKASSDQPEEMAERIRIARVLLLLLRRRYRKMKRPRRNREARRMSSRRRRRRVRRRGETCRGRRGGVGFSSISVVVVVVMVVGDMLIRWCVLAA